MPVSMKSGDLIKHIHRDDTDLGKTDVHIASFTSLCFLGSSYHSFSVCIPAVSSQMVRSV